MLVLAGVVVANCFFAQRGYRAAERADKCYSNAGAASPPPAAAGAPPALVPVTDFDLFVITLDNYVSDLGKIGVALAVSSFCVFLAFTMSPEVGIMFKAFHMKNVPTTVRYVTVFLAYMLHCWAAGTIFFGQFNHMSDVLKTKLAANAACLRTTDDMSDMMTIVIVTFVTYTLMGIFTVVYLVSTRKDYGAGIVMDYCGEGAPRVNAARTQELHARASKENEFLSRRV